MRAIGVLVTACAGLMIATLVQAAPAQAYDAAVTDVNADRSRTFLADEVDRGTIFSVNFDTTQLNEKRYIYARLRFSTPSTISDVMIMAYRELFCDRVGGSSPQHVLGVQNVLRGQTITHTPRMVFTAAEPGSYRCWVHIISRRVRPVDSRPTSNVLKVSTGSYLTASVAIPPAAQNAIYHDKAGQLIDNGSAADSAVQTWTAPPDVTKFDAVGDTYLTTCSAVLGSWDPVVGTYRCDGRVERIGSWVRARVVVGQLNTTGTGYCALTHAPTEPKDSYISIDVHHRVLPRSTSVPVRTDPGCSRNFRIKMYVKHLRGAAVLVGSQGTITMALP